MEYSTKAFTKKLVRRIAKECEQHPCFRSQKFTDDQRKYWMEKAEKVPSHHITKRKFEFSSTYLPVDVYHYIGDAPDIERIVSNPLRPAMLISSTVYRNSLATKMEPYFVSFTPAVYSMYFNDYTHSVDNVAVVKDFCCFIGRMDPSRQGWFYQLIRRNLLSQGFVSFKMDHKRLSEFNDVSPEQAFEAQYQKYMTIFAEEHQFAKNIVPYRNFEEHADLDDLIMQSRFNIVLETFFDDNDQLTFTEKIIRSLRLPRPWLLFSSQHAVKYLRDWGFDVLDDLVDHDRYDNIEFNIDRQTVILDMAQELLTFDTDKHWDRLHAASQHNLSRLKYWQDNLDDLVCADFTRLLDKVYEQYYS
jgi:hypothetical protein